MAFVQWTREQMQVIETRDRNLLVSAAAGSGKTAVLVERIIRMVTDENHPVDIDKLLVMTFTNAAASEMRERIGDALEKRLEECPGNINLERQTTLIHHAKITTIDSFCLKLLREHFNELDIDPGFRIGDEGELKLLQADVMKSLLEEYYGREDERFLSFVDAYALGKADGGLEDYILQVWHFAQSNPWPGEWISKCREELYLEEDGDPKALGETEWMRYLIQDVKKQASEFSEQLYEALEIAESEDGPAAYVPALTDDMRTMERLAFADTYEEICKLLSEISFGRLAAVRGKQVSVEKKEKSAGIRNRVKDAVKKMKALYAPGPMEQMYEDLMASREPVFMLLELASEFTARYQEAKEEKNLVDFNDLEHFALDILTGGSKDHGPGPVADELSREYEEILVDEYQDSNEVQETLIRLLSRERFGTPNVFMVGDVKQSIYKFRLAKPELFLEKYETYKKEGGLYQKIELHKNFRSRPEVLSGINDVFYSIMTKSLGGIQYTEDAALHPGAGYPETLTAGQAQTEVLLLNTGEERFLSMDEERADYTAREAEARLIAAKIKEMTDPETGMKIWNGKKAQYECLKKKDIVILLRSLSGWAEEFLSVLSAEGIPAFAESRTGYFTAVEVETVLNMLALIDNPMQDIPLVGALKSPIAGLTDRELSMIMAEFKQCADKGQDMGFYGAVKLYLKRYGGWPWPEGEETMEPGAARCGSAAVMSAAEVIAADIGVADTTVEDRSAKNETAGKLGRFWGLLSVLRREAEYLPVHRLLYRVFELTGYYDYVSAMPAGRVRQANLDMLVEKAAAFEQTSYQSLFDFIRYIEKLKKYSTDFGEAARAGEDDDTVRIMSIHKSKGLEFPVVFLAGAGKAFNRQDSRGKILIDETLGVATDFLDVKQRTKAPTLKKNVLARKMNLESMGEELRILYVAMTRAKEKLVITAADKYLENKLEKWGNLPGQKNLPFTYLSAASSYLDWILMASGNAGDSMSIRTVPVEELLKEETKNQIKKTGIHLFLRELQEEGKARNFERLNKKLRFSYPHEEDVGLHAKMSVSELKERGQFVDDGESDFLPTLPAFLREGERKEEKKKGGVFGGTFRGTAYHRVLELLSFKEITSMEEMKRQLFLLEKEERMDREALSLVSAAALWKFFSTPIAIRMQKADKEGRLHKESQFVMGIPARLMDEADSDELVLIQGIIDAWFEEGDGIVLVDYKTDRIQKGEEAVLLDRYRLQMIYYGQALKQITGKPVKESVIYSLALQKEILVG